MRSTPAAGQLSRSTDLTDQADPAHLLDADQVPRMIPKGALTHPTDLVDLANPADTDQVAPGIPESALTHLTT